MGGKIWVESIEGAGTQFHFTMVLNSAEDSPPTPAPPLLPNVHPDAKRVLVVEHSLLVRQLLCRDISNVGLQGDEASDFVKAMECLRTKQYAIIIVDGSLADADAFIRGLVIAAPLAKVIFTSNLGMVPHLDDANVITTLIKPIRRWRLINALEKGLDQVPSSAMKETFSQRSSIPRDVRRQSLATLGQRHPLRILVYPKRLY